MLNTIVATAFAAYFLGSIPTGFLVGRARGLDLRKLGSGNIGATNALRVLGRGPGTFVLLVDALKGFLACTVLPDLIRHAVHSGTVPHDSSSLVPVVGGTCAVLGHNFTFWLRFKGGKGVATSAGVLAGLLPLAFGVVLAVFLAVLAATRFVSLSSLAAAAVLPGVTWATRRDPLLLAFTLILSALVFWRHRANIQRLRAGTEPRIGAPRKPPSP